MKQRHEWTARVTASAGRRVALRRAQAGLSVQALAGRCAELGLPLGRVTISKLELGMRQTLNIGELLVLAAALDVPPVLLICPVGQEDSMEALPGQELSPWDAAKWFCGSAVLSGSPDGLRLAPPSHRSAAYLFREHDRLTAELAGVTREMTWGRGEIARLRRLGLEALRSTRETMREQGLSPPPLPDGLAWTEAEAEGT